MTQLYLFNNKNEAVDVFKKNIYSSSSLYRDCREKFKESMIRYTFKYENKVKVKVNEVHVVSIKYNRTDYTSPLFISGTDILPFSFIILPICSKTLMHFRLPSGAENVKTN